MTIIDLNDGRVKTTDDKKLENKDFGIISRGNPRFFRFGPPLQLESWAENSLIGKFYIDLYDQIKQDVTPVATKVNNLDKIIQQIEAQIVVIGPSGTMRSPATGEDFDARDFVLLEDRAIIVSEIVDEAIKLGVSLEPVTEAEANRLLREGGAVGLLESVAQEASAEITSALQKNEDLIQKWEGLNQSEDPELARSVLYEHDPKEFQRVAINTERVTWSSLGGAEHAGDTQTSDQAFRTYRPHPTGLNGYWEDVLGVEPIAEIDYTTTATSPRFRYNVYDRKAQGERQRQIEARDAAEAAKIERLQSGLTGAQLRDPDTVPETEVTETVDPNVSVSPEADPIFGVSGISNVPPPDPANDPIFGDFGAQADTVTVQQQTEQTEGTEETGQQPTGTGGPTAAQMMAEREADRDEVYALLQEQFGGASYFFRDQATNMRIGVTADGTIVSYDDESRERTIPLMQYIVDNGITSMTRVRGLLQKTKWWQTTDVARRTYDVMWGEMSDPERVEWLEPTTDALTKEAQFLGFDLSEQDAFTLAQTLAQNGDSEDTEAIREMIIGQLAYNEITNEFSDFSAGRDALEQLAYKYYVPQTEETAQDWAEKIYTGEATQTEYEQYLKDRKSVV